MLTWEETAGCWATAPSGQPIQARRKTIKIIARLIFFFRALGKGIFIHITRYQIIGQVAQI